MTAEEHIIRQIVLNRIALLEARTEQVCALLAEEANHGQPPDSPRYPA